MNLPLIQQTGLMVSLPQQDQSKTILAIITRAALIAGTRPAEEELIVIVTEVQDLVRERFKNLTIEEIAGTVRHGVLGDYEDSYLCVRNINTWLKKCQAEKYRKEFLANEKIEKENQMHMAEKVSYLMDNIDKMPSLKALLDQTETKRAKQKLL